MKKIFFLIIPFIVLTGCNYIATKSGYVTKEKLEIQLIEAQKEKAEALKTKEAEIKSGLEGVIAAKDGQIQAGANAAWASDNAFRFYEQPTRLDIIINNRVKEIMAALGVPPTLEAIKSENERLTRELDEKLTSMDQLRVDNAAKIKENEALVAQAKEKESKVTALEKARKELESAKNQEIEDIQDKLIEEGNRLIIKEKENSKKKQYIEANKRLIMSICGLVALASLAGAIFSPLFKKELGILSGVTGAVAIAIPFVEPLHIGIVVTLVFLYILYKMERKGAVSLKTNENLINAIQTIKENKPDLYKKELKPELLEWNTKYKGSEKIEDEQVSKNIESILKEYERK
jgi:hypothetical protein